MKTNNHSLKHISANMKKWRQALHQIPEIGFQEFKTQQYLIKELTKMNLKVQSIVNTGLYVFFDNHKKQTLALRADMDGLSISEKTKHSFQSTHQGLMHACGHDGHMAALLGVAQFLSEQKQIISNYNILLIFQPAEEGPGGALSIVKSSLFDKYRVTKIFGMHLMPLFEQGTIVAKSGPMMASATEFDLTIEGKSAHVATPKQGIDALKIGAQFVLKSQKLVQEKLANQPYIYGIGQFNAGVARNIVAPQGIIKGTYRSFDLTANQNIKTALDEVAHDLQVCYQAQLTLKHNYVYPPVINDQKLFAEFKKIVPLTILSEPFKFAEDFAFYQEAIPGVFFFVGTKNHKLNFHHPLHSDLFDFDEQVLITALKAYQSIIKELP